MTIVSGGCSEPKKAVATEPPAIRVETRKFEKSIPGCGDHGSHEQACVSFRAGWPELSGGDAAACAKMNAAILTALGFPGGAPAMETYGTQLIDQWRVKHRGVVYADSTWFERRTAQVLARRPGVWSFQIDRLGQTGTEVPFDEHSYLNLSPKTGAEVGVESLLSTNGSAMVKSIAERSLRKLLSLDPSAPLPLKDGRFVLPSEYNVQRGGLTLRWNVAEFSDPIAAPAEILLPWHDIREYVDDKALAITPDMDRLPF
jgi:hypothetical protein